MAGKKLKWSRILLVLAIVLLLALVALSIVIYSQKSQAEFRYRELVKIVAALHQASGIGVLDSTHDHAAFKVYTNGNQLDLWKPENEELNLFTHMHVDDPDNRDLIHIHATGITLEMFFRTLGMELSQSCINISGQAYCTNQSNHLRYFVNNVPNFEGPDYRLQDLDRILITYGVLNSTQIVEQLKSVGDNACIES